MKLIRFGEAGKERPGVIVDEKWYDAGEVVQDYDEDFFASRGLENLLEAVEAGKLPEVNSGQRLGCPVYRPSKIMCIGLNYAKHAKETNAPIPKEPIVFFKAPSSVTGPNDAVIIPKNSQKTDWEVELAVVIGKRANYVSKEDAMNYVAGYCVHNDVSEREFQLERGGQWVKGKSADTFAPLGPWLVTKDEVKDVHNLRLWLKLNGKLLQDGNTNDLIFNIPHLVSYLSQFMSLMPGDIISTGTPHGVGLGLNPQVYLKDGDVMELGIEGLGEQRQEVKKWSEPANK